MGGTALSLLTSGEDMKEQIQQREDRIIRLFIVIILIAISLSQLNETYGFSLFPDEFGYWAAAGSVIGYDWSAVVSLGSYYSFGYALILTPVLALIHDSVIAYRTAVVINLMCQIASYFLLCDIVERLMPDIGRMVRAILCGAAVLYPSWVLYTQMTMAEGLIFFLYTLSIWCLMKYMEAPGVGRGTALAVVLCYMYCVHMRTIGALIAGGIIVIVHAVKNREGAKIRRGAVAFICTTITLISLWFMIRYSLLEGLYGSADPAKISVNNYSGQIGKIGQIFSLKGFADYLLSLSGKILYLGCATFGMAYIGLYRFICKSSDAIRQRSKADGQMACDDLLHVFIALASLAQIGVMSIYLAASAGVDSNRFDLFLHGRYDDFIIPILMVYGMYGFIKDSAPIRRYVISATVMLALSGMACMVMKAYHTGMDDTHDLLMIGMSYLLDGKGAQSTLFPLMQTGMAVAIGALILTSVLAYRQKSTELWLLALAVVNIVLGVYASGDMIRPGQAYIYGDIQLADRIGNLTEYNDRRIVDLHEGGLEYIDTIQFRLREKSIDTVDISGVKLIESSIGSDDIVLVDWESGLRETLSQTYDRELVLGHFAAYYNREDNE